MIHEITSAKIVLVLIHIQHVLGLKVVQSGHKRYCRLGEMYVKKSRLNELLKNDEPLLNSRRTIELQIVANN